MERYGLGHRRAAQGVRNSDWSVCEPLPTGHGLADEYLPIGGEEDLTAAIQDSIGYTSRGSPYATRDEIAEYIAQDSEAKGNGHPEWLLPPVSGEEAGHQIRQGSKATESGMGDDDDEDHQCPQGIRL